ncbi:ATP-dependent DNA helicase RecG [Candidatus Azambacteria bacterium]|nr:ATP-dependent DNA helicase RecG [Candidatus Azambacteria bacterium]
MNISDPIQNLKGVNSKITKQLEHLNVRTIRDLLFNFPRRYDDFSVITKIKNAKIGETCTISGIILSIENTRAFRKRMTITSATISDGERTIKAIWYNQPFLIKNIHKDQAINIAGKVGFQQKSLVMQNPAYEVFNFEKDTTHTGRLVPVYAETRGITSRWIRLLVKNALPFSSQVEDILPKEIKEKRRLINAKEAIEKIHFPKNRSEQAEAKKRISYEELFLIQLVILNAKKQLESLGAPAIKPDIEFTKKILKTLPFELTDAQKKALWQVFKDVEKGYPMNRLVEGDVGSGKTLVALLSAANAAKNGWQSAFMAPTEILAIQHFYEAVKVLGDFNLNIALLTASAQKVYEPELKEIYSPKKNEIIKMINSKKADIVIGTHSLIQDKVGFKKLGLVILDEQHRFGVDQRAALIRGSASVPHLLSMTATPIPRTLAMTAYGDLDISLIDEMPKNRKKIITKVVPSEKRKDAYAFIESEVKKDRQVFVVCPKIENKDDADLTDRQFNTQEIKAVKDEYEKLSKKIFPHLRVAMLHGKMKPKEKEKIMKEFKGKEHDILVSTSVVEVGVDVPNATIMMIEGAERFGLAQMHQFRGRVGRGEHQSYCFLFSESPSEVSLERLKIMEKCESGFELAEYDLKLRGPGDFFGKNQSGIPDIAMEALINPRLISEAQEDAKEILEKDPSLSKYPKIFDRISKMRKEVHFE